MRKKTRIFLMVLVFLGLWPSSLLGQEDGLDWRELRSYNIEAILGQVEEVEVKIARPRPSFKTPKEGLNYIGSQLDSAFKQVRGSQEYANLGRYQYSFKYRELGDSIELLSLKYKFGYRQTKKELDLASKILELQYDRARSTTMTRQEEIWLCYRLTLKNLSYGKTGNIDQDRNVLLGLEKHPVVCEAYAMHLALLLSLRGFENKIVSGLVETGERHAWNMVKVQDQWFYLDPTFGDSGDNNNQDFQKKFFLLSKGELETLGHSWEADLY